MNNKRSEDSGVLFQNNKRTGDNSPVMTGNIELSKQLLKELIDLANNNEPIKFRIAGWSKEHPTAGKYLSLKASGSQEKAASKPKPRQENLDIPF
jgi:hypothetical protein